MKIGLTFQPTKDSRKGEQGHGDGGSNDQKWASWDLGATVITLENKRDLTHSFYEADEMEHTG